MINSNLSSTVLETTTRGTANTRVFAGTHVARYDRSRFGALCGTFVAKVAAIVITFVESRGILLIYVDAVLVAPAKTVRR